MCEEKQQKCLVAETPSPRDSFNTAVTRATAQLLNPSGPLTTEPSFEMRRRRKGDAEECVLISEISQLIHQILYVYLTCVCSYEHTLIKYLPHVRLCWKLCTVQPQAQHHICRQGYYPYRYLTPNRLFYAYNSQKNKYVMSQIRSPLSSFVKVLTPSASECDCVWR